MYIVVTSIALIGLCVFQPLSNTQWRFTNRELIHISLDEMTPIHYLLWSWFPLPSLVYIDVIFVVLLLTITLELVVLTCLRWLLSPWYSLASFVDDDTILEVPWPVVRKLRFSLVVYYTAHSLWIIFTSIIVMALKLDCV